MKSCCDEYCSNYGCNQGRDCPARVAKVGRRYLAHIDVQPPSPWRRQLRALAYWMLLGILGWIIFGMLALDYYFSA